MSLSNVMGRIFPPLINNECKPYTPYIISRISAITVAAFAIGMRSFEPRLTLPVALLSLAVTGAASITAIYLDHVRTEKAADEYAFAVCLDETRAPTHFAMLRVLNNPSLAEKLIENPNPNLLDRQASDTKQTLLEMVAFHSSPTIFISLLKKVKKIDFDILTRMMECKGDTWGQKNYKALLELKDPGYISFKEGRRDHLFSMCPASEINNLCTFGFNVNERTRFGGFTPLMTVCMNDHIQDQEQRVTALSSAGADPTLTNNNGERASDLANQPLKGRLLNLEAKWPQK